MPIFWQVLGIFSLACSKFWSKHQVIDWSCYIFIFLIGINYNFDHKSQFLETKCRNLKKIAKFIKNLGYQVKLWTKYVSNNVRNFNRFLYSFYFMKKSCLVLKLCHFKFQCLDFPMKIGNLANLLLNCCEKIFFKKTSHTVEGEYYM